MTTDNARSRMSGERNMPLPDYPLHRRAAARYCDAKLRLTHVIVGDHQPEPRVAKLSPSNKPRWPCRGDERKHISEKYCGGIVCQMGLNGKCVACGEDD